MSSQEKYHCFLDQLHANAVREFQSTRQYDLLKEKLEQMDCNCDTMFREEEKDFALECFALIRDADGQQEKYLYRKGLEDCVMILKQLGVLA